MREDRAEVLGRLPRDLKRRLRGQARRQGVSPNQMTHYSLAQEVAYMEAQSYLDKRLEGKPPKDIQRKFHAGMGKIKGRPVPEWNKQ